MLSLSAIATTTVPDGFLVRRSGANHVFEILPVFAQLETTKERAAINKKRIGMILNNLI